MQYFADPRVPFRALRVSVVTALLAAASRTGGCVHNAAGEASTAAVDSRLPPISADDRAVYNVVLAHLLKEYARTNDTIRVMQTTMVDCDPNSWMLYHNCLSDRYVGSLERQWASGGFAFSRHIGDSTRAQLEASFRSKSRSAQLLTGFDPAKFRLRPLQSIDAEATETSGVPPIASIVASAAGHSAEGYAYVYAVYSRTGTGRGYFATGIIFLLRKTADGWTLVEAVGTWVT